VPPLRDDVEREASGALVELPEPGIDDGGIEVRTARPSSVATMPTSAASRT
jgi:hypothetical protein